MHKPLTFLLLAAAFTLAGPAGAKPMGVPDPARCVVDPVLVGSPLGVAVDQSDGAPGFDVYARDGANAPLSGSVVSIDFTFAGLTLYASQNAGTTIDCATHTISQVTDAQGHTVFAAQFGSWQDTPIVPVLVNGVEVARVKARSPDYDEDGRVAVFDLSIFSLDYLSTESVVPRSDFDASGALGVGDLAVFAQHFLGQLPGSKPLCP